MRTFLPLLMVLALGVAVPGVVVPGGAAVAGDAEQVEGLVQAGVILPFDNIRRMVMAQVHGDYVGADFDRNTLTYRFRFLVDGNIINVDVDARNGQRIRTTKHY